MLPTIGVPCRVDYRPAGAQHFCEWTGRVNSLSATGCSIRTRHQPEADTRLELRIYLHGSVWPMRVSQAEIIWSHWDEFTVEFLELSIRDRDQLQRWLMAASALVAASRPFSLNKDPSAKRSTMKPRYSLRKPITGRVLVSCGGRVWGGGVVDLTVPGCRVQTAYPLERGQSVQLRMHVDGHPSLHIDLGMVRWATQGEAGIEFIRMAEADQLRLRCYVGEVDPRAQS